MIEGEYLEGEFEFCVNSFGEIEYVVLNGYKIYPDEADLGKLVNAYFKKLAEDGKAREENPERIFYV